jgi:cysteinyl-tRNA synthetase
MMVQLVGMFAESTVYSNVHLGNANFMSFDIVLELFTTFGLQTRYVRILQMLLIL